MYKTAAKYIYATYYHNQPESNEKRFFYYYASCKTDNEVEVIIPQMYRQFAEYVNILDDEEKGNILNQCHINYPILLKYFIKG